MTRARWWRARELLLRFTEGFDTRDLKSFAPCRSNHYRRVTELHKGLLRVSGRCGPGHGDFSRFNKGLLMSNAHLEAFVRDPQSYLKERAALYDSSRYLGKAAPEWLDIREKNLQANIWTTRNDGRVCRMTDAARREFFYSKIIEVQAERQIRSGSRGEIRFDETAIIALASRDYTPIRLRTPPTIPNSPFLVRYSKERYIKDALSNGIIQIKPARGYNDASLTPAQRDDELIHIAAITPHKQIRLQLRGTLAPGGPEIPIPHQPLEVFRFMEVPDFYVLCCAASFNCRMFKDFKADAALVIHGKEEFIRRIGDAVASKVPSTFSHRIVRYYDPYANPELIPAFSKNLEYAYQDEYRFVWKPSQESKGWRAAFEGS